MRGGGVLGDIIVNAQTLYNKWGYKIKSVEQCYLTNGF